MTQDDLTPWHDTPLVHALTADGTPTELSGQDAALAAFRESVPSRRRRSVVRLLGTGATSIALLGVVGGGVAAAAYTRSLPDSMQSFVHDVFAPIGVPAPTPHKAHRNHGPTAAAPSVHPVTSTSTAVTPSARPTGSPGVTPTPAVDRSPGAIDPTIAPPAGSVSPSITPDPSTSAQPTVTPTPTATTSPSPIGPAGDPSTWSVSATASRELVPVHHGVRITGTLLDAAGAPVADRRVVVRVHDAGTRGWQRAAVRRTDENGSVQAWLDDLTQNIVVVLGAGDGVHSSPIRIVVQPAMTVSSTPSADGTSYVVTVTADGGDPGDLVDLVKHTSSGWVQVGEARLDDSGSASFSVPAPKHQRGYVLRLAATTVHGDASTRIVLQPLT